ncbi:MAPEG family protein [Tropicimonas sp. IMCC34043]|uniref:MAPEG family protein n=1 Tax=Tropicimonas sp. IMCC34043 TaxID=2248760 RepID=UPI001E5CE3FD|nr:MAPEG family protein [Tropicimonas sp. IMCC34043]
MAQAYSLSIAALVIYALLVQVLSPMEGMSKARSGLVSGATPAPDYGSVVYRIHRAYQNSVDNVGTFTAVVMAAILAGAPPFWVNLLAVIAVLARIGMVVVHVRGIGRAENGPRSMLYALGVLMTILIGLLALVALFG